MKSRLLRLIGLVAGMWEIRYAYNIFALKPDKPDRRSRDDIEMDVKK
jgi:hypothetical protein